MTEAPTEWLFSYGTLQQQSVQLATFRRLLAGRPDRLPGFRLAEVRITDPQVLAESGKAIHPIALPSPDPADGIDGTVFAVTPSELADADRYEVADYTRVAARLASGIQAWVYVAAADAHAGKFV
jgi:gamma-glutamylcyclotransferase (GGCT)/AIG2-like uncharacterized protein YtfP